MAFVIDKPARTVANIDENLYRYLCKLAEDVNAQNELIEKEITKLKEGTTDGG